MKNRLTQHFLRRRLLPDWRVHCGLLPQRICARQVAQSSSSKSSWNTTLRCFTGLSLHEPGGARRASCLLVALGSFPFAVVSLPPPSSLLCRSVAFARSISASSRSLPVLVSFPWTVCGNGASEVNA
jgi:hypothetical protein